MTGSAYRSTGIDVLTRRDRSADADQATSAVVAKQPRALLATGAHAVLVGGAPENAHANEQRTRDAARMPSASTRCGYERLSTGRGVRSSVRPSCRHGARCRWSSGAASKPTGTRERARERKTVPIAARRSRPGTATVTASIYGGARVNRPNTGLSAALRQTAAAPLPRQATRLPRQPGKRVEHRAFCRVLAPATKGRGPGEIRSGT